MTRSLLLLCSLIVYLTSAAQPADVPTGVKLTPAVSPPAIVASNFSGSYPNVNGSWQQSGDNYSVTFNDLNSTARKRLIYSSEGKLLSSEKELVSADVPRNIQGYYSMYYPKTKPAVWQYENELAGARYYGVNDNDTIKFDANGKFIRTLNRNGKLSLVNDEDVSIVRDIASLAIMDVTIAELAAVNSANPQMKLEASQRIEDRKKFFEKLKTLAEQKQIPLPTELDEEQQVSYNRLALKQQAKFDKDYRKLNCRQEKKMRNALRNAVKDATDPAVKEFAQSTK
jgi:predicted outer membrane protein